MSRRGPVDPTGSLPLLRRSIRHRHHRRLSCPLFRLSRCRSTRWGRSRSCLPGFRTRLRLCPRRDHRKSSLSRSHWGMSLRRSNPSRKCTRRSLTTHRCHRPCPRCRRCHRHRCRWFHSRLPGMCRSRCPPRHHRCPRRAGRILRRCPRPRGCWSCHLGQNRTSTPLGHSNRLHPHPV